MPQRFIKIGIVSLALAALVLPAGALAAVFSSNEVVQPAEPVDDDVFFAGERVTVDQTIADDAYLAGGIIEVLSNVGEDVMAAGNSVTVSAPVGDDAFLAGDRIVLEEDATAGDLFAAGRSIEVRPGAAVSGDAYLAGAVISLHGAFGGDVRVGGESVEVGEDATIAGDLIVHSPTAPAVADGATITGVVRHVPTGTKGDDGGSARSMIAYWVRSVVTYFIASIALLYIAPRLTALVIEQFYRSTLASFGIGLLWVIVMVPATVVLFLTIIGWPLALAVIFICALLLLLSCAYLPLVVGTWLHGRVASVKRTLPLQWQHALLGAVVVVTLQFIPVLGQLLIFVLALAMLGTLLRLLKKNA